MTSKKSQSSKPGDNVSKPIANDVAPRSQTRDFEDPVNEASDESFPASDPPAWTDTTATKDGT